MNTPQPAGTHDYCHAVAGTIGRQLDAFLQADRDLFEAFKRDLPVAERARRRAAWSRRLEALRNSIEALAASSLV